MYKQLEPKKIIETIEQLGARIAERLPDSNLRLICDELLQIARLSADRCAWIKKPNLALRIPIGVLVFAIIGLAVKAAAMVRFSEEVFTVSSFFQTVDGLLGSIVYLGATILFLVTLEARMKRSRALEAIHELRALAHIVDLHQLTKDPEAPLLKTMATPSSPERKMTPFELNRYYDYCSEILSCIGKLAAVYVQHFHDPQAMAAVDQIEDLTTGLSQKIWQKSAILSGLNISSAPQVPGLGLNKS